MSLIRDRLFSYAEKSINSILDYVSASSDIDTALMQKFYDETNKSLAEAKNEVSSGRMQVYRHIR